MNTFIGTRPERRHVQALYRCNADDSKELLDLFETKLESVKESLLLAEDPTQLYRLQGKASMLKEFLAAVKESPEILERLR